MKTTSCDCGYCAGMAGHRTFFADDPRAEIDDAAGQAAAPMRAPATWGALFGLGARWHRNAARHWGGGFAPTPLAAGVEVSSHARR